MSRVCIVESFAPPLLKNAPPKMTLHPLLSKGGAFVLKLGLVFSQSKVRFALIFYLPHQEIAFKAPCKPFVIAAAESRLELHSRCA